MDLQRLTNNIIDALWGNYEDDLFDDGIIYHYPHTNRHSSFDKNEIEATKNCKSLGVPLFVITHNESNQSLRDVKRGWVEMWDDDMEEFLITFSDFFFYDSFISKFFNSFFNFIF